MPLGANALISFADAQLLFGYDADEQTKVERLIAIVTARAESYTGRKLKARDYTDILISPTGTEDLLLPEYPVNSIAKIAYDPMRVFGPGTEYDATDYSMSAASAGLLKLYSGEWPRGCDVIRVSYNAGIKTDADEWPLIQAAALEYLSWIKTRFAGSIGKRSEINQDGANVGYEIEMPLHVKAMLDPFRRV